MKLETKSNFLSRNVRFVWLAALFLPPILAFFAYQWMPHEAIWHEVIYSLLCLPIFAVWLIFVCGCLVSFLIYRSAVAAKSGRRSSYPQSG